MAQANAPVINQPDPHLEVLKDILLWSQDRPAWLREALRILVERHGYLFEEDIVRLLNICKSSFGLPAPQLIANPFTQAHVQQQQIGADQVSLVGISEIEGINALADNVQLSFAPTGITLNYGDNGAGKSSFTRILKKTCRCTAPSTIQPNIFTGSQKQTAKISYVVGNDPYDFVWEENSECPPFLNSIRVFDSKCAEIYVTAEQEAYFTPYGISILTQLANSICPVLKQRLEQEKLQLTSKLPDLTRSIPAPQAVQWIRTLSGNTPPAHIDAWTNFSQEKEQEFNQLHSALGTADPQKHINSLTSLKARVGQLSQFLSNIDALFSKPAISTLQQLTTERNLKREEADKAIQLAFGDAVVPDTGTPHWRTLWEAARAFIQESSSNEVFPATTHCPLCQQELTGDVRKTMDSFEQYVRGTIESQAQTAQAALNKQWQVLHRLPLDIAPFSPLLEELPEEIKIAVLSYVQSAQTILPLLTNAVQNNDWNQLPQLAVSPLQVLSNFCSINIDGQIKALQQSANPKQRAEQQQRYNTLASHKVLSQYKQLIQDEVKRLAQVAKYDNAISSTNSLAISRKSGALAEQYVTPELQRAFNKRLKELFGDRCFVSVEKTKTSAGTTYFKLKIDNALNTTSIADIASEGEFRAIALAAFLAEIDLANDSSGIVFDDPVSSFDHKFREKFAKIIREISLERQVIIFTHDLFFISCITYWGNRGTPKITPKCTELITQSGMHGFARDGVPMEVKPFKQRKLYIEARINVAKDCLSRGDIESCLSIATGLTSEMRKITERTVEEVLFNSAVVRYDPAIHTQKLHSKITKIEQGDIDFFVKLMDRYSLYPHDQSAQRAVVQPDIGVIETDLSDLQTWVTEYNKRV